MEIFTDLDTAKQCPICHRILGPNTSIKRHIAAVHLKVKNHECSVCRKRFFRKNARDRHLQRHSAKHKFWADLSMLFLRHILWLPTYMLGEMMIVNSEHSG